jgi:hypothetical protein
MNRAFTYLGISLGLSFASAVLFVILMTLTLPESDMAHGQMPFEDPIVFPMMGIGATVIGLLAWPLFLVLGWRSEPFALASITGATVLATIVVGTPLHPALGFPGSCLTGIAALLFCFFRARRKTAAPETRPEIVSPT